MDKNFFKAQTFQASEMVKIFKKETPIGERLREGWWLTCMAYGIYPENPPKMEKHLFTTRKYPC